jgi:ferric-dicitrate binding protein FerR (iron transport regulator)
MGSDKRILDYLRLYLGLAGEREYHDLVESDDSIRLLHEEWEHCPETDDLRTPFDKPGVLKQIVKRISGDPKRRTIQLSIGFFRRYAAVLVTGLLISSALLYFGLIRSDLLIPVTEFANTGPRSTTHYLPDGSQVFLNTRSSLIYTEKLFRRKRTASLVGEAYFEITENPGRPFLLDAEGVRIEVLGTRFNVRAYPEDETIETTLLSGKVRISRLNPSTGKLQSVILSPEHQAVFYKLEERFIMDKVDPVTAVSWTKTPLRFDNESLESLITKLQDRYGVKILLSDDDIGNYRITMSIDNESIEEVLVIIGKTLPLEYSFSDGIIEFSPSN